MIMMETNSSFTLKKEGIGCQCFANLATLFPPDRASTALKLTFEVCPEMRKHMEILPKMGFIQARSSFNVQLKFLPR